MILRSIEQGRFSDAGFAADDQCGAAVADAVNQPVDEGYIVVSPV